MARTEIEAVIRRVGSRVRARRARMGITGKELAERSGLSPRFVAQLEAGQANIAISRLAAVARALELPIEALVARDGRLAREAKERAASGRPIIVLLGLRGAGKTTIGPLVARQLDRPFVELDERIEEAAGLSLGEIFSLHGEQYYRRLEAQVLASLLDAKEPVVVALSGGVVHNDEAFDLACRRCTTVWLRADPEDHMQRVLTQGDRRPMANRSDAMGELRALLAAREPLYGQADFELGTSGRTVTEVAETLCAQLG